MSKATLLPLEDIMDNTGNFTGYSVDDGGVIVNTSDCPFSFLDEPQKTGETLYKIYNDGGHYIATPYFHSYGKRRSETSPLEKVFDLYYNKALYRQRKREYCNKEKRTPLNVDSFIEYVTPILRARFPQNGVTEKLVLEMIERKRERLVGSPKIAKKSALDIAFDSLYVYANRLGLKAGDTFEHIKAGLLKLFPDTPELDTYITDRIEKKARNFYARKKRFRRKGNLNRWTHFVTFTYDDQKQTAETFRKKLRKCLSNLHTRRGWRYMGCFEEAPETGRLHFHGLFYIPDGQMIGTIEEKEDYSVSQGKMQTRYENDFFMKSFGRNDFKEISMQELKQGKTLEYILKYIEKTGERIVYSRGIPTQVCKVLPAREIVGKMQDFCTKFVLFDDSIEWERDVMHYTRRKQLTIIDILCNPPRVA